MTTRLLLGLLAGEPAPVYIVTPPWVPVATGRTPRSPEPVRRHLPHRSTVAQRFVRFGGVVSSGPGAAGGWSVHAVLPLGSAS